MLIDNVNAGDKVEITQKFTSSDTKMYHSKVETVIEKTQVIIQAPISAGAIIKLHEGEEYYLRFLSEKGIYQFLAAVADHVKEDGFLMVVLKLLDDGYRIQNRNFFRVICSIPVSFSVMQEVDGKPNQVFYDGLIRDLGGGGMKLISKYDMNEMSMITSVLQIEDENMLVFGEIRHKVYNFGAAVPYQYGIRFASLPKPDQEKLVQYLTNEQLKSLQRAR